MVALGSWLSIEQPVPLVWTVAAFCDFVDLLLSALVPGVR